MASPKLFHSGCSSSDKMIWKHVVVKSLGYQIQWLGQQLVAPKNQSVFIGGEMLSIYT